MISRRRTLSLAGALAVTGLLTAGSGALAQAFPVRPMELVVPFAAGTAPDSVARALAEGMSKELGQQVVVVNRPGAGGAIGYKFVQSRKPDGYTMVLNSNSISTVYYSGLTPFDYSAFDPIARVTLELPVLVVQSSSSLNNLKDVLAYTRKNPGAFRVGSSGVGSHMHLTSVAFFGGQSAEVTQVPFPTTGHVPALMGGHIEAVVTLPGTVAENVKSGALKVLGALSSAREPVFPDAPTAREQGYDFQSDLWRGITVPKGTPPAVIARLEEAVRKAVTSTEFKQMGERMGFLPAFQGSAEFGRTIASEDAQIAKVMTKAGLVKPPAGQ